VAQGLGNNAGDYARLAAALRDDHGLPAAAVARVSRPDWLRNAAGLVDANYWRGTLRPRPVLDWSVLSTLPSPPLRRIPSTSRTRVPVPTPALRHFTDHLARVACLSQVPEEGGGSGG
jgi:hypothetical protein